MWTLIVQARAGSTRLPEKIFKMVRDLSLLEIQIDRLKEVKSKPKIILATTTNAADDKTEVLAKKMGIQCFRGSEEDVLSRYFEAARRFSADPIGRVTSDCPLIDPDIIDSIYNLYRAAGVDYVSNTQRRTFPRGLDIEIFSFAALKRAFLEAKTPSDREHVTPFIRNNPDAFSLKSYENHEDFSFHRWTVDTNQDFQLIENLLKAVKDLRKFRLKDILQILNQHPDWSEINAHIEQKKE